MRYGTVLLACTVNIQNLVLLYYSNLSCRHVPAATIPVIFDREAACAVLLLSHHLRHCGAATGRDFGCKSKQVLYMMTFALHPVAGSVAT